MLNFIKTGTGNQHLVFIHGNSQSANSWFEVINNHSLKNYTNIAVDLPGHGFSYRSTEPEKDYCYQGLAKRVEEFVLDLKLDNFILIGLSLGTNMIGEFKSELKNCNGIMLISPCVIGKGLQVSEILDTSNPIIATCFAAIPTEAETEALINDASSSKLMEVKQKIKNDFIFTDPCFRSNMGISQDYTAEIENLEARNIPIAVVFGEQEKLCFKDYLNKIEFKKWRGKTILVPDAGHCIQFDQPEVLANIVSDFAKDCF